MREISCFNVISQPYKTTLGARVNSVALFDCNYISV
jgi:hypothetical protein